MKKIQSDRISGCFKLLGAVCLLLALAAVYQGCGRRTPSAVLQSSTPEYSSLENTTEAESTAEAGSTTEAESTAEAGSTAEAESTAETESSTETESSSAVQESTASREPASEEETTPENTKDNAENNTENNTEGKKEIPSLRVEKAALTDSDGNAVVLKGISTHGLAWFPDYVNEDCFRQFHEEFGINVIRLALYTAEYNGYCTGGDKEYLKTLVNDGVEYAVRNDMYVIIDWHVLSEGNPNVYINEAKAFFEEMSAKYADYTNVIYEICNEPNGGASWSDIKSYAEQVIAVIRQNDSDAVIIVGTPNWSQYIGQAAADPITGYGNIMYALHFYAATHTDWLRNEAAEATESGLPVFVSEFGICDASGNGAIDEYQAGEWIKLLDKYNVSRVMWNLSNKNETSAILNSSCNKKSGFEEGDLSAAGKWFKENMNR